MVNPSSITPLGRLKSRIVTSKIKPPAFNPSMSDVIVFARIKGEKTGAENGNHQQLKKDAKSLTRCDAKDDRK